jgi:hypothetical protein
VEVGVGDKVLYSKYAGTDIKLGGEEYVLLSEKTFSPPFPNHLPLKTPILPE